MDWKEKYKKILLGLGLDAKDGHTRITKGKNFYLLGGSKTTHNQMQETAIKFNEQLKKKNKTLDEISEQEFIDISHKVGLKNIEEIKETKKRFQV
ncbi:MAG: hypothetical protein PHS93_03990 [Candidatus Omnitrophica bacterium]|nr:hypothetical protein [Candidatus Omnitrophota bacterium]MDD5352313.1 hypothetical protein [Candidatus Omnitrophota bacterium]MDD5549911.1 hypothetical protein [Candidatus Omnitrophota bacterium]